MNAELTAKPSSERSLCLPVTCIVIMSIISMALVASISEFKSIGLKDIYPNGLIALIICLILAIIIVLLDVISLFRNIPWIDYIQVGVLIFFDIFLLFVSISIFGFRNLIINTLENTYRQASNHSETVQKLESTFHCCGFDELDQATCLPNETEYYNVTCQSRIADIVSQYSTPVGSVLVMLFLILAIVVTLIVYKLYKSSDQPEQNDIEEKGALEDHLNNENPIDDDLPGTIEFRENEAL